MATFRQMLYGDRNNGNNSRNDRGNRRNDFRRDNRNDRNNNNRFSNSNKVNEAQQRFNSELERLNLFGGNGVKFGNFSTKKEPEKKQSVYPDYLESIDNFISAISENIKDGDALQDVISNNLYDVASDMAMHYHDAKRKEETNSLYEKLFATIGKERITKFICDFIENEQQTDYEDFDSNRRSLGYLLSTVLVRESDVMNPSAVKQLINVISDVIWSAEVTDLIDTYGVDSSAAVDVVIRIPIFNCKALNFKEVKEYAPCLIDILIDYSESSINTMDKDAIKKLICHVFTDEESTRDRAVSVMLSELELGIDPDDEGYDEKLALLTEYRSALMELLEDMPQDEMRRTLQNILNRIYDTVSKKKKFRIMFNPTDIFMVDENDEDMYPNIKKAVMTLLDKPHNSMVANALDEYIDMK